MTRLRPNSQTRLCYLAVGARDRLARQVAWRLPRRVAYWAAIRVGVHASTGRYSSQIVPDLTVADSLQRWDRDARAVELHSFGR